ncbi:MAG: class I SAM-dependent methyltransferase [Acidobacteria bacterium]|nr:class I SAM-dependent methyltransferase [Acidobacteriota bacterium]
MSHLRAGFDAHHNRLLGLIRGWVPPPANLLEVGCASGHLLALAREAGYEVMGLEPARHNLGDMPRSLAERIMASPVESADLPAAGFDVAVAVQLIEHLLDPSILLEKLARALKPGGIAYLETPNFDCLSRRFHHKAWLGMNVGPGHWHIFNPRSLKLLSEKWEFETVRSWTFFKALSAYGRGRMARTGVAALNLSVAWLGLGNNLAVIIRRRIDRS